MNGTLIDTVRLREKGEITMPKKTREYFGLQPGDLLGLELNHDNQLIIHKLETIKVPTNGGTGGNGGSNIQNSHLSTKKQHNGEDETNV